MEFFDVVFRGRELKASPTSRPGVNSNCPAFSIPGVEAYEEENINSQVMGYVNNPRDGTRAPLPSDLGSLPEEGQYDYLLQPGRSVDLLEALPSIFQHDPPVACGANPELVGLSCAYRESYSTKVFSPGAVAKILQLSRTFWNPRPEDNVQQLIVESPARIIVVGDVHGQLEDVLWLFFKYGPPSPINQYLFNGDIVDRGGHSLEILILLFALKRDEFSCIHVQRGNHEDVQCGIQFGFRVEMHSKFGYAAGGVLFNLCANMVFPLLPIASLVTGPLTGGRSFCVLHGGVPVNCPGQTRPVMLDEDLCRIDRTVPSVQSTSDFLSHVLFNLLWSDPVENAEQQYSGKHGRGNRYAEKDTIEFCELNNVAFVVRSHEVPRSLRGAVAMHQGKCFTVFSASNYMGSTGNRGGIFVAEVGKGLQLREHQAPPFNVLVSVYTEKNLTPERRQAIAEDLEKPQSSRPDQEAPGSPRSPILSPALPSPLATAQAERQQMQFVMERICEQKDQLYMLFRQYDQNMTGLVTRKNWADVMLAQLRPLCPEVVTPGLIDRLGTVWLDKADKVGYIRFLHRFQIKGPDELSSVPDLMREVSKLRKQLLDAPAHTLEQLIDPNGDRAVSCQEFCAFLPQFNIDVPPLHAGALYNIMAQFTRQDPLTVDNAVLCLAIMGRDPPPVNRWSPIAERIGAEIARAGKTYAFAFRIWDLDRDGFLSLDELQTGLQQLPATRNMGQESIINFMTYMEDMGVSNRRVSMFEFVRAVAPRNLAIELHGSMLKEILKRVWICRALLSTLLAQCDPRASNRVSVNEFRQCLAEINNQLEQRGRPLLSDVQVASICEIASGGTRIVEYDRFINGLHVVDLGQC